MNFIERHKALILTCLTMGMVILGLFSIHLKQQDKLITESYYLLEPEPEQAKEQFQQIEDLNSESTNKAFNEDQEYEEMMRNFKTVSPNDFERTTKTLETTKASEAIDETSLTKSYTNGNAYALNTEETKSYRSLQEELEKRLKNKKIADEHAKTRSTLTYSLKGRTLGYYDIPRYLCEEGGKIVVSIRVNRSGDVIDASLNGASTSTNQCLIDHAIDYAKSVQFDSSTQRQQLGTITFLFKAKP